MATEGDVDDQRDTCIYCEAIPRSEEHPLPAALGEFVDAPLLQNRICAECNSKRIGLLDEQFTRCGPEALLRVQLGIIGRTHHEKANPFYRGSAGGGRIEALSWDENFQCNVNVEFTGGNRARQLTELIFIDAAGVDYHIPLRQTATPEMIRDQFLALKLSEPYTARVTYDPPTEGWARDLIVKAFPAVIFSDPITGSSMFKGSVIGFRLSDRYFRAIAKIGFHYFLTQFPMLSGLEPEFHEIRNFIITDTNAAPTRNINQFIKRRTQSTIFPPYRKDGWLGHVLVAEIRDGVCLAHFEPFVHGASGLESRTIRLGRLSNKARQLAAHLHLYFPDGKKQGRFSGQAFSINPQWLNLESGRLEDVIAAVE